MVVELTPRKSASEQFLSFINSASRDDKDDAKIDIDSLSSFGKPIDIQSTFKERIVLKRKQRWLFIFGLCIFALVIGFGAGLFTGRQLYMSDDEPAAQQQQSMLGQILTDSLSASTAYQTHETVHTETPVSTVFVVATSPVSIPVPVPSSTLIPPIATATSIITQPSPDEVHNMYISSPMVGGDVDDARVPGEATPESMTIPVGPGSR